MSLQEKYIISCSIKISFVHLMMAVAKLLTIIGLTYLQVIHGQSNGLLNNPAIGQNNLKQGFSSGSTIKSVKDALFQNDNLGNPLIYNSVNQANSLPSAVPQQSLPAPFSLQQQPFPQLVNQQSPQIQQPELQLQHLYQPQNSNLQQPIPQSSVVQQPYSFLEGQTFIPVGIQQTPEAQPLNPYQYSNVGNINFQQQLPVGNPIVQQIPIQISQPMPTPNLCVPSYSTMPAISYGGQQMEIVSNLSGNYLVPIKGIPMSIPDAQLLTTMSSLPYTAVVSNTNPTFGKNIIVPYQNQNFGFFESSQNGFSDYGLDDEESYLDYDNLTSVLLSLLQTPKKSPKYVQSSYEGSPYAPFTPYKKNQGSKSSSLKALLPVIFNLIKERTEGCQCGHDCDCKRKMKKDVDPQINGGYSKKRDYSMKEEMFRTIESSEDIPRITREHKKTKKKNKPIPKVSVETIENDTDYDRISEEEED